MDFYEQLCMIVHENQIKKDEAMKLHTTFRVGGPASFHVAVQNTNELAAVLVLCRKKEIPFYILGNGSNLLVGDLGYTGVMITLEGEFLNCDIEGTVIESGAGALLSRIANQAAKASLAGFEFAAGIPGTLGGAIVMNAGAYGSEMKAVLVSATVLTPEGKVSILTKDELDFGYRTSSISRRQAVVLSAKIKLEQGEASQIREKMDDLAMQRKSKQPLEYPSAGSTFKRPEGYFAGKLIEEAGLCGFQVGGAQVAEKHCGFVINRNQATASDIMRLCFEVQEKVKAVHGVDLELEIKLVGNF